LFAQYATNSDGTLSEADFEKFMKENTPPPPPPPLTQMQNAMSAYEANSSSDLIAKLLASLEGQSTSSATINATA